MRPIERWERFYASRSLAARIASGVAAIVLAVVVIYALAWAGTAADWVSDKVDPSGRSDVERCIEDGGSWCAGLKP